MALASLCPRPGRLFRCYTTGQGLSHNNVLALANGQRGFLWVSTASGLNRFDGVQFKAYAYTGRAKASKAG